MDTPPVDKPPPPPPPPSQGDPAVTRDGSATGRAGSDMGFLLPPARPDSLGRLGHYEVLEVLGRGGFGIVFRAFDDGLHRVVAIKVLSPDLAATSPARQRFLREARAAAQVRHEHVVQIYAVQEQPLPYLVMEFIPGESLQQRLDRLGPFAAAEVAVIGRQTAEGLAAAHAAGLIHRDVKPGNILVEAGPRLRVKLTDFGLARAADDASLTQSGVVTGTPLYMSPEQAQGETLDHRTDLFSLGSVLYAITSGRPPFRANNTLAVLKRVAEETPRPIPEIIPETPAWLCDLIARLHAKHPNDRFQSGHDVAQLLAHGETQLGANSGRKDSSPIPRSQPAARRSRRWTWAAAVLVLAALVGVGLYGVALLGPPPERGSAAPPPRVIAVSWGEVIDPRDDCRFTEKDGQLTITVPADRPHDLNPTPGHNMHAPRVLRSVEGDFEARVTVQALHLAPWPTPGRAQRADYFGAGLIVWQDDGPNFLRLFRTGTGISLEWWVGTDLGGWEARDDLPDEPIHLRVRRTGDLLLAAWSHDGQEWTPFKPVAGLQWSPRLRAGVAAVNMNNVESTAVFEGFAVTMPTHQQ